MSELEKGVMNSKEHHLIIFKELDTMNLHIMSDAKNMGVHGASFKKNEKSIVHKNRHFIYTTWMTEDLRDSLSNKKYSTISVEKEIDLNGDQLKELSLSLQDKRSIVNYFKGEL